MGGNTETPMTARPEEPGQTQLDPVVQSELAAHLNQLALLLEEIQEQVARQGASHIPALLAQHRAMVYRTLIALGDWINEFLARKPAPSEIQALRHQVAAVIQEWSRTSPLLRSSLGKPRPQGGDPGLITWLLDMRPAGADVPALVLNDFYRFSIGGRAYRERMKLLVNAVLREIERRVAAGNDPVRILSLHISGASEVLTLEQIEAVADRVRVTCLDTNPQVLRAAVRALPEPLKGKFSFVNADALHYATSPNRPAHPFDLIYGIGTFDHLESVLAAQLAQGCHSLLAPGGMLLAGSSTSGVPSGERILRAWLTDWEIHYRDEVAWREFLTNSGFDLGTLRFEYEPLRANMLVSIERSP